MSHKRTPATRRPLTVTGKGGTIGDFGSDQRVVLPVEEDIAIGAKQNHTCSFIGSCREFLSDNGTSRGRGLAQATQRPLTETERQMNEEEGIAGWNMA